MSVGAYTHNDPGYIATFGIAPSLCFNINLKHYPMAKQDNTPSINIQVGAETGKLRIIEPDGSVTRLYATVEEVRAVGRDKIAERIEYREGDYGPFAVLMQEEYKDLKY